MKLAIGLSIAMLYWCVALPSWAQYPGPDPCYSGPPSSAQQCRDKPPGEGAQPIEGKPYHYGDADNPVQCIEDQLVWIDEHGCRQYCRLSTQCGPAT